MEKRGSLTITIIIVVVIIIIITIGIFAWQSIKITNQENKNNKTNNISVQENLSIITQQSNNTANLTQENETSLNETEVINTNTIPNPTGSVSFISKDGSGEYFCNDTENPEHAVRVYTYKIINGTKNLSKEYIKSDKINVCDDYNNASVMTGVTYYIEWKWDAIEGIDGYRAYQYYDWGNITRNYDYFIDTKTNKILDTGLDLWRE